MSDSTTCVCEPSNMRLCCDRTCWCKDRGLNGNAVVAISIQQELPSGSSLAGWQPALSARISHIAGFPFAFCDSSINGLVVFLCCGTLLSPVIMLLWTCTAIETTLTLLRSSSSVSGTVTRRSACCSWHTRVEGVAEVRVSGSDGEGPDPVFIHYLSGAAKLEISTGFVPELEAPVNDWIQRGGSGGKS